MQFSSKYWQKHSLVVYDCIGFEVGILGGSDADGLFRFSTTVIGSCALSNALDASSWDAPDKSVPFT